MLFSFLLVLVLFGLLFAAGYQYFKLVDGEKAPIISEEMARQYATLHELQYETKEIPPVIEEVKKSVKKTSKKKVTIKKVESKKKSTEKTTKKVSKKTSKKVTKKA